MNFRIHFDNKTACELDEAARALGYSRNRLIRQAVREWLDKRRNPAWPEAILRWRGVPEFPPFESYRDELLPPG